MAHWNEIDNISEKLLKKILLGENKADAIPSQEDHVRLTDKYKNWNALADQSKKVLKYDANKAFQKLQFQKYRRRKIITGWSIAASIVLLLSISIFFIQEAPEVMEVCQNAHLLFLCTKPRLSQAGALLLPKDIVSLSIQFILCQRYIFALTIPTKPCFSLKELMRILQRTIRCAWLTLWLRA